jgi:hypothetical protein
MGARVWVEAGAVDRLSSLGLTVELFGRVMQRAEAEVATCTPLDPPIMPGMTRWGRIARYFREEVIPLGWTFDNPRNLPRTINPTRTFAVVPTTGDGLTGVLIPGLIPSPKYPKGYATELAVAANEQLTLDLGIEGVDDSQTASDGLLTWLLLFLVTADGYQLELSVPDQIEGGRITSWTERIVLPFFPRTPELMADRGPEDGPDDIVVEVNRR